MNEVTQLLQGIDAGDGAAAAQLLPLVYEELRRLAGQKLAHEKAGQTLDATGLVHEAYLRLVGPGDQERWRGRTHFFAAAAEAMRRILIDNARRKKSQKRGGQQQRVPWHEDIAARPKPTDDVLAIDEALTQLETEDPQAAGLVKLRFYAGLSLEEAAEVLGLARASATASGPMPGPGSGPGWRPSRANEAEVNDQVNRDASRSTMVRPICSEAVAAGEGASQMLTMPSASWIRKSSTRSPSGVTDWALMPGWAGFRSSARMAGTSRCSARTNALLLSARHISPRPIRQCLRNRRKPRYGSVSSKSRRSTSQKR